MHIAHIILPVVIGDVLLGSSVELVYITVAVPTFTPATIPIIFLSLINCNLKA